MSGDVHFFTTSPEERDAALQHGYHDEGTLGYVVAPYVSTQKDSTSQKVTYRPPAPGLVPLLRAWHPRTGAHFYTADLAEWQHAIARDQYVGEGVTGWIAPTGDFGVPSSSHLWSQVHSQKPVPVYRLFNRRSNDHLYTTSAQERDRALSRYVVEGVTGYAYAHGPSGSGSQGNLTPLFRLYQPGSDVSFWAKIKGNILPVTLKVIGIGIVVFVLEGLGSGATKVQRNDDGGLVLSRPL